MSDHMKKIFRIIRKTGERVILADFDGDEAYVLMSLDEYEHSLQISPSISPDLPVLESPMNPIQNGEEKGNIWRSMKEAGNSSETWDLSQMSATELEELEHQYQTFVRAKTQDEEVVKKTKEPSFSEEKDSGEGGEEQFYLEPIE